MGIMKMGGKLLHNLFSKPATEAYPFEPRNYPEASRGHLEFDNSNCILCNLCGKNCPVGAIHADKAARTLTIERMQCIQCEYCCEKCPKSCLSMHPGYTTPDASKTTDVYEVPEKPKPAPTKEPEKAEARCRRPGASRGPMCRTPSSPPRGGCSSRRGTRRPPSRTSPSPPASTSAASTTYSGTRRT